ncbi:uncharacterized protein SETTUDRAFT_35343 [Exserohilum turcica Et28A]|uniref:Uncharacterized protein n=1 Tax=Exserohilum turcicum (strain 28A) TaxID=671987 RepID=R0I7G9_EXST2|nr:uncharacterized protein SETTUDRAFT_35343 [Exserohilum turcica Et28A]EOA81510.1 hypothetical protein SETTUDRAFT_35343 [Exserohilum turcica Et28A]
MYLSILTTLLAISAPVLGAWEYKEVVATMGCVCMERAPSGQTDQANLEYTQGGCDLYQGVIARTSDFWDRGKFFCAIPMHTITPATWDQDWCRKHWPTTSYGFCNGVTG